MRLPNGYGSVYKLPGNRRRPWVACKTTGWSEDGKQLRYIIGYYKTRALAMTALAEYNKNPIGERGDITLGQLYDEWAKSKYPKLSTKTVQTYETAWKHLSVLDQYKFKDIKTSHLQELIDNMDEKELSYSSIHKVKVLAGLLYKHAMADDITDKNYAQLIELPERDTKEKPTFTDIEIKAIEKLAAADKWANSILMLIYTGMRVGELLKLTKFNVDIKNMIITGGGKTEAGKNRIIPVHPKIQKYIEAWYNSDSDYLINKEGKQIRVDYYRAYLYYPTLERAGVRKLTPHICRHTFASLMKRAKVDNVYIQKLIGHASYATTADIYTHPEITELRKAIEML